MTKNFECPICSNINTGKQWNIKTKEYYNNALSIEEVFSERNKEYFGFVCPTCNSKCCGDYIKEC